MNIQGEHLADLMNESDVFELSTMQIRALYLLRFPVKILLDSSMLLLLFSRIENPLEADIDGSLRIESIIY